MFAQSPSHDDNELKYVGYVKRKQEVPSYYWNDAMREDLREAYNRTTLSASDCNLARQIHAENIKHTLETVGKAPSTEFKDLATLFMETALHNDKAVPALLLRGHALINALLFPEGGDRESNDLFCVALTGEAYMERFITKRKAHCDHIIHERYGNTVKLVLLGGCYRMRVRSGGVWHTSPCTATTLDQWGALIEEGDDFDNEVQRIFERKPRRG